MAGKGEQKTPAFEAPSPDRKGEMDAAEQREESSRSFFAAEAGLSHEGMDQMRARLKKSRAELDATLEQLRAVNDSLKCLNEKYSLTAEDLETTKSELQTINRELQTVNAELQSELDSVARTNNDLKNFMSATEIGALFLDRRLRIKRFTPKISDLFDFKSAAENEAIVDLGSRLGYPDFARDAEAVLNGESLIERELELDGRWFLSRIQPYSTLDGRIEGVACTFIEITERVRMSQALKSNEEHMRLLLSELSHRVKNTLAVVQAMARLSFRFEATGEEALEAFTNRLSALSAAHDVLVQSDWRRAVLQDLVERQLTPFAIDSGRTKLIGPAIFLRPDLASPLALVIHELASNAVKYGAFSTGDGVLQVDWGFIADGTEQAFHFRWQESGGPKVEAPAKQGFGVYMMRNGLPDAEASLDFNPNGFLYCVKFPVEFVLQQ